MAVLNDYFERVQVINLVERRDRRRDMEAQLKKFNLTAEFFPAVKPAEVGDWPSLGARGCFLSHYNILKQALDAGARNVLILEDDLDFSPHLPEVTDELLRQIEGGNWGFLYLGHVEPQAASGVGLQLVPWTGPLMTTHFLAVNQSVLERVVFFMEQVLSRPDGHPLGGPQHVDGAYSMFRAQNPDIKTLLAAPPLGWQRSSRSDVSVSRYESIPVVRDLLGAARRIKRALK
ncbi:glycosyltransferase family 25 protein [Edaphobacter flagellatus]|uniref:glycosyltransferase family 25 protein n=1 Tax=Edaphobacter flagellatus TaxID=1933044 RepID=UPI0021B33910|nr:glycosyltransferase family 25 protein [Edaphobacter flagellatus]